MNHMISVVTVVSFMFTLALSRAGAQSKNEVKVCYQKTAMLVFPENIRDADGGSADIIIRQPKRTENVLKVKSANRSGFAPTNLSVITTDGKLYSINVIFDPDPAITAYDGFEQSGIVPQVSFEEGMSPAEALYYARLIATTSPRMRKPVFRDNKMELRLNNVFINNGLLFFSLSVKNFSQIPYDINFSRFYLRDLKQTQKTTYMEKEIEPRITYLNPEHAITGQQTTSMVVAFEKFTIAQKKQFTLELYEKGGDRQLKLRLKGKHILSARPFIPR